MTLSAVALSVLLASAPAARPSAAPGGARAATQRQASSGAKPPTAAEAKAFVARVNDELKRLWTRSATADWIKSTYITDDTEKASAWANEEVMAFLSRAIAESVRYKDVAADPETKRALYLLRTASTLPAPSDPARRAELATIAARLEGLYGKGKWCGKPAAAQPAAANATGEPRCRDLEDLSDVMRKSRSWDELLDAWVGWRTISPPMRKDYERLVALGNEGAREIGFANLGELWRAGYDMTPAAFEQDTERLWGQVKPLYDQLHCYVRAKLQQTYGPARIPDGKPIPAHVLGNMWAQDWSAVYPIVEPFPGVSGSLDIDAALQKRGWDPLKMVKTGEAFFTSLGLAPLPATFWDRSMFTKPRDREVVCHASAWDVTYGGDIRIKMCIKPIEEDLVTIHHELGHDYYYQSYFQKPVLFQQGANDGFHEAIGDAIALSVTPAYYQKIGLLDAVPVADEKGVVNVQMKRALEKIAFLPFGKLIDQWRWDVFSGAIPPSRYNAAWWELRRKYQGVDAPVPRSEADFDPGAKYHIPANVPYTRYFLAHIYQFQFHRALCRAAGHQGPLHTCSIYGNPEAGRRLAAMLAMGASRPWPDAMEALTGERQADASALMEYFAPLRAWLENENRGRKCGW
ncbi:MAG TPA: M2 family metallopeptidase [Anaeromyxobacteraceae bacterium]|nr:M2 family metallopeptidase [Anaeromyxobacteraceae bacterium]